MPREMLALFRREINIEDTIFLSESWHSSLKGYSPEHLSDVKYSSQLYR